MAAVKVKKPHPKTMEPTFEALEDGALSNDRCERFALMIADDITPVKAWVALGGRDDGGSNQYRRSVEAHPAFVTRLAFLRAEKEELMADPVMGDVTWMAKQMWREARATANSTMMQKAAEMLMKIVERRPVETPSGRGPGAPVKENPQTSAGVEDIKNRLIALGLPTPGDAQKGHKIVPIPVEPLRGAYEDAAMVDDFQARLEKMLPA